ncbi:MAG TPA: hypothetical protein VL088_15695 [Pedobacter sp.]|nr:hypothetical protein [Pedobacter sp.]
MEKKLLSRDYDAIVFETLNIPESDFFDYYLNIVNEHYTSNPDITVKLMKAIARGIEWYRNRRGDRIRWDVDKSGNKTLYDQDKTSIPLYPHGIHSHINKSFFDSQTDKIQLIDDLIGFYDAQREIEKSLPDTALKALNQKIPFPNSFDIDKIKERIKVYTIFRNEFIKSLEAKEKVLPIPEGVQNPTLINNIEGNSKNNDTALSFEGLFIEKYKQYIPDFIEILRGDTYSSENGKKALKPLINSNGKWIGNKQAAHLFYRLLLKKDIVQDATIREIGDLFSQQFEGLGNSFSTTEIGVNAWDYEINFTKEIENVLNKVT